MKAIAITPPVPVGAEASILSAMLEEGWWRVHLRHPGATVETYAAILADIPAGLLERVTVHDHFALLSPRFPGIGIQENSRQSIPAGSRLEGCSVSRGMHGVDEALECTDVDYVTLSPIFDSISKQGYRSPFSDEDLRRLDGARVEVMALGGVDIERIPLLARYNFGGFAMLGAIPWQTGSRAVIEFTRKTIALC